MQNRMFLSFWLCVSAITLLPSVAFSASLECTKPKTFLEQSICSANHLKLREQVVSSYNAALKIAFTQSELKEDQLRWLSTFNICQDDECVEKTFKQRISFLNEYDKFQNANNPCKFDSLELPNKFKVYAAGNYAGKPVNFQIDQSGSLAGQIDVSVNNLTEPVVLMLGAYDPTVWNIKWTEGTKILAVFASGYHRQVIAGLPHETSKLISTHENRSKCGDFYIKSNELNVLNPKARMLFNQNVDKVYLAENGNVLVGNPIKTKQTFVTSNDAPPSSYYDESAPLAGKLGLDKAVSEGLIRKAINSDAEHWVDEYAKTLSYEDIPPVEGLGRPKPKKPDISDAYVIIKPFTYPAGLYGGHSVTFFIPKGVPTPKVNSGHSTV